MLSAWSHRPKKRNSLTAKYNIAASSEFCHVELTYIRMNTVYGKWNYYSKHKVRRHMDYFGKGCRSNLLCVHNIHELFATAPCLFYKFLPRVFYLLLWRDSIPAIKEYVRKNYVIGYLIFFYSFSLKFIRIKHHRQHKRELPLKVGVSFIFYMWQPFVKVLYQTKLFKVVQVPLLMYSRNLIM